MAICGLNAPQDERPDLSVVVALQNARHSAAACVDSLLAQTGFPEGTLEVILVDGSQDGTAEYIAECYPSLTLLKPEGTSSLPGLLGVGITQARGRLIAITEGICTFAPDWAATAIAAHDATDSPVIGGAVKPGQALRLLDWAVFFCDYGQFLPLVTPGPTHDLPGNNVVFKREILSRRVHFAETGFWKTFFCQQLEAEGRTLIAEPHLAAYYHRRLSLGQLIRRRYIHGRCFGGMRARSLTPARRAIYAVVGPVMPWLLTYRLIRRVWPKDQYRLRFVRVLPLSFLALLLWLIGEWIGNLFGPGETCRWL